MSFSFRYKPVRLKSGYLMQRPMIPFVVSGKEKISVLGMLDSGSDLTIIPKEIAEAIELKLDSENEVFGISGIPVKCQQGKAKIAFGKGREVYEFEIPILVPEKEGISIIIGRVGFFNEFKITFVEEERKIEFKKYKNKPLI